MTFSFKHVSIFVYLNQQYRLDDLNEQRIRAKIHQKIIIRGLEEGKLP